MVRVLCILLLSLVFTAQADARSIVWSGYKWHVRWSGVPEEPIHNMWSDSVRNVRVMPDGRLRLAVVKRHGRYYSSEVRTTQHFGLGRYEWVITSDLRRLHPERVLGLFTYPEGLRRRGEQDVEFSRWGSWGEPGAWLNSWQGQNESVFASFSIHKPPYRCSITWRRRVVDFECHDDHTSLVRASYEARLPPRTHAHINYWNFPSSLVSAPRHERSLMLSSFKFTPLAELAPKS
jgi:hypothetical protein